MSAQGVFVADHRGDVVVDDEPVEAHTTESSEHGRRVEVPFPKERFREPWRDALHVPEVDVEDLAGRSERVDDPFDTVSPGHLGHGPEAQVEAPRRAAGELLGSR